jgi:hypothetical protein
MNSPAVMNEENYMKVPETVPGMEQVLCMVAFFLLFQDGLIL